jgi:hypothetical protein
MVKVKNIRYSVIARGGEKIIPFKSDFIIIEKNGQDAGVGG